MSVGRRILSLVVVAALVGTACSKKSTTPTSPPEPDPACIVSASSLDFSTVYIGSSADQTFTVTNAGGGTLSGTASTTSSGYAVVGGASFDLTASQQATVTVRYSPSASGSQGGTIVLTPSSCGNISCTGTGQDPAPVCVVSPTSLDFGTVPPLVCAYGDRSFVVRNAGGGMLTGTVSSPCAVFTVLGDPTYSLAAGARDTFIVRFAPSVFGAQACDIVTGCGTVRCTGSAVAEAACASVTPTTIDFGTVPIGMTVSRTVTISGVNAPFDLAWASEQIDPGNFQGPAASNGLQPGDVLNLNVRFTPTSVGLKTGWFQARCKTLIGDGQWHPFACVRVTGTGQ